MPAPAVYIIAVVGGIAAGIAFKEFVYDPHIAPKFEEWRQELQERNRARRRRAADVSSGHSYETLNEAVEMQPRSSPFNGFLRRRGNARPTPDEGGGGQELHMYPEMTPTHVIAASSGSGTPTTVASVVPSRSQSPTPSVDTLRSPTQSHTVFDASDEQSPLSSPGPTSPESTVGSLASRHIPSLSLSYDHREHDEELLEAPSSPSSFGGSDELFMSFTSPTAGTVSSTIAGEGFETASPYDSPVRVLSPARSNGSEEGLRSPHFTGSDFSDMLEEVGSEMSWTSARVNSER